MSEVEITKNNQSVVSYLMEEEWVNGTHVIYGRSREETIRDIVTFFKTIKDKREKESRRIRDQQNVIDRSYSRIRSEGEIEMIMTGKPSDEELRAVERMDSYSNR